MRPLNMQLMDIVIKQLDLSVRLDKDFRQYPGQEKYLAPITLKGQPNIGDVKAKFSERESSRTGDEGKSRFHIVFSKCYLDQQGITLKKGDRIISIGGEDMEDVFIKELRVESPFRGRFLLLYAMLEQRRKSV